MGQTICVIPECANDRHGRGVCRSHYMKAWRGEIAWPPYTDPPKPSKADRFWAKVDKGDDDDCWRWTASIYANGYGQFDQSGAHRFSYEINHGAIPHGMVIDHLCRERSCVNPSHLELVTQSINVRRGYAPPIAVTRMKDAAAARTHCKYGHELTPENTYVTPREGWRQCRACRRGRKQRKS